jgi:type II secretory pathway component PulF
MLSIAADERAALQFDEVASMLDAGLPLGSIGGGGEHGDRVVHAILSQRGVKLTPSDDTVLLAAWRAGRIGPALRARAEQRRQQAALHRRLLLGLAYPSALFAMTIVAGIVTAPIVGHYYFPIGLSVLLLAVVATALVVQRGLQRGDERWNQLPVIGPIARDVAEIPYLEVLQALYGAGVPLLEAHASATAAVPNHGVQQRLGVAGRVLGEGRSLAEALAQSVALHPDTRTLLANGERGGQLEDALQRALQRRREVSQRAATRTAVTISVVVYALAGLVAIALIFSFYQRLYGSSAVWRR